MAALKTQFIVESKDTRFPPPAADLIRVSLMNYLFMTIGLLLCMFIQSMAAQSKQALYAPMPNYPFEARRQHYHGSGVYAMHLRPDCTVESVEIVTSAGNVLLDKAAVSAFRKWRFPAGSSKVVRVPFTFAMVPPYSAIRDKSAGEREGTTDRVFIEISMQSPYPKELRRRDISANARLRLLPGGAVRNVTFDRSSVYPELDTAAAKAFKRWKFPRSTQYDIVLVPITFTLKTQSREAAPAAVEQR